MPTYEFFNKDTGQVEDHIIKLADLEKFKQDNPHLEKGIYTSIRCCDPVIAGRMKPADGFRDLLKNMKKKHRRSTINDW